MGRPLGAWGFPFRIAKEIESKFFQQIPSPRVDYTLVNG